MSKLELPADVANKVMGMLKVKERPFSVLIVETLKPLRAKVKMGSISEEERDILQFTKTDLHNLWWEFDVEHNVDDVDDIVHLALSLEFKFRGEPDRARWQHGKPFEMYREALCEIA